jgi:ribose 1,5-bisphosphokinase
MSAPLIYVMGPSGAGKDSVLDRARTMLSVEAPVAFAHRYITRPADIGGENHVALRRTHGLFAFHWHAHGNDYGIGREIDAWRAAGLAVVVSGSRQHYEKVAGSDPGLHPVLITAALDKLRARLSARGRETAAAAASRLARSDAYSVNDTRLVTIVNDGALDAAAEAFVRLLATLRYSPGVRRRA